MSAKIANLHSMSRMDAARALGLSPNSNWAQINHANDGRGHRAAAPVQSAAAPSAPAISIAAPPGAPSPAPTPPSSPEATDWGQQETARRKNRGFGYRASLLASPDAVAQMNTSTGRKSLLGASQAGMNTATGAGVLGV